jgi:hypothetical protein
MRMNHGKNGLSGIPAMRQELQFHKIVFFAVYILHRPNLVVLDHDLERHISKSLNLGTSG